MHLYVKCFVFFSLKKMYLLLCVCVCVLPIHCESTMSAPELARQEMTCNGRKNIIYKDDHGVMTFLLKKSLPVHASSIPH